MPTLKLLTLSLVSLLALAGCVSRPAACPPPEPMPAELIPAPQNLTPLLDRLISPSDVD